MELLHRLIEDLVLGRPLDRATWREIARHVSPDGSGPANALAALATLIASEDLSALDSILARIPARQDWMRAIATAVVAARRLAVDDRQSLRHMVDAGFTLLPQLADQMHTAGLERLVDMQSRVIALDGDQLDPSAVGWLASLVNTLSMSAGNHTRLSSALAFADRLEAMPDAGAPTARLARFSALSNLITTCKQLAKTQPEGTESYLVRAAELALCVCRGRQAFVECCPDPAIGYQLIAQAIGNLMFACAELSRMNPARTARLSVEATPAVAWLRSAGEKSGDAELCRHADRFQRLLTEQASSPAAAVVSSEQADTDQLVERINAATHGAIEAGVAVVNMPAGPARSRAIAERLERMFGELELRLAAAVGEVGINRHISRVLLCLGAISSGRLWPLAMASVSDHVLGLATEASSTSHAAETERNQDLPPYNFFTPEASYIEHVCALAAFGDTLAALATNDDLAMAMTLQLRERNRALLHRVLPAACAQHVAHRGLTKRDDLAEIARRLAVLA